MHLRLLGPVQVIDAGGAVYVGGPKERTVLAVLAVGAPDVVAETALIDAMWPDDPPRTASRTLQSYVSRLRKALVGAEDLAIEAVPGGYRLAAAPGVIDIGRVERLGAEAREAAASDDLERASSLLAEALAAWTGRPLGEFADEPWAQPVVARLEELRRTMFEERIDADLACGRHALLVGELDALCKANPFRERLWAQRMIALYRSGRQADALAAGREVRRRLVDELGVDPGPDLQALERAILVQDASLEVPSPRPKGAETGEIGFPPALEVDGELSGRTDELERLLECWRAADDGSCRAVFIGGEPGIGKSRLASELAKAVHAGDALVLFGTCEEDLDVAYQPFAEALRSFVQRCPLEVLRSHVRKYGGDVARVVPELALRLSDVPAPLSAEPEAERFRLFEATSALLDAAAGERGLLLVLDDLQWATKPTLLMLRHLLRDNGPNRTMIVGLYRDTETSDILTDTLADFRRLPHVQRLSVEGLDVDGIEQLLVAMGDQPLDHRGKVFAKRLHEDTGGSPFFVNEVVLHLVDTGDIYEEDGQWTSTFDIEQFEVPASVREVILRRVGRLEESTRNVLTLAAVIGPSFSLSLLERANGLHGDALLDGVEEAVVSGMVRDVPGSPGTYTFSHALVRHALYDELSALRRARLHRRVAEALEAAPDTNTQLAEIAHHYVAAAADGVTDKAIEYASRAASNAISNAAYEEAVHLYEQALEVAEWADLDRSEVACDLLLGLGNAQWKVGEVLTSRATYDRAAELARQLDDPERFGRAVLRNPADLGGFAHAMASNNDLIALLEEALTKLDESDTALRASLLARLSVELFYTAFAEEHRSALADRAVAIAERVGDPEVLLFTLHCREWATAGPDVLPEERQARTQAILELADQLDDVEVSYQARFLRFVTYIEIGDFISADMEAAAGRALADRLGIPGFVPWVTAYDGLRAWIGGRMEDADTLCNKALTEALTERSDPDLVFAVIGSQVVLFRYLRDLDNVLSTLEPMAEQFPDFSPLIAGLALAYMQAGKREECARVFEGLARHDFADHPREGTWLAVLGLCASVCAYLGDEARARVLYDYLRPYADRWISTVVMTLGPTTRVLGRLAMTLGLHDEAETWFEESLQQTKAVPAPVFRAETCYDLAEAVRPHDPERADELLSEALQISDEIGLHTLRNWIEATRA